MGMNDKIDIACDTLLRFSTVPSIKRALSYPVVREEIRIALNDKPDIAWHTNILKAIAPFLREGIIGNHNERIANQSRDIAVNKVSEVLVPPIGMSVIKGIQVARNYDSFFHRILANDSDKDLQDLTE